MQLPLHFDGALHSIYDAGELGQEVIARRIDNPPRMLFDKVIKDLLVGLEGSDGGRLVVLH